MNLIEGHKYSYWYVRTWIYDGEISGMCDQCGKPRKVIYQFHAEDNPSERLKLGSECVKEMSIKPD